MQAKTCTIYRMFLWQQASEKSKSYHKSINYYGRHKLGLQRDVTRTSNRSQRFKSHDEEVTSNHGEGLIFRCLNKYHTIARHLVFMLLVTVNFCHLCQLIAGRYFLISAVPFPNKLTMTGNYPALLEEMLYDKQWMFHWILWKIIIHFLYLLISHPLNSEPPL
jgi:hypothetical protein